MQSPSSSKSGLGGFIGGLYGRTVGTLNQMIPAPTVMRRANPFLAAALELIGGLCCILGLGRIYAGDTAGGFKAMIMWWVATFVFVSGIGIVGTIGIALAIPTLGISLIAAILFSIPFLVAWLSVPFVASGKLYAALKRM